MVIKVREVMSKPAVTISENETAMDAGRLMRKVRKGLLVVMHEKKPIGIVSDSDLINQIISKDKQSSKVKIKGIMSTPFISIGPSDDITNAVKKMKKNNIHRLPVVDKGGELMGVVSLTDIARASPDMMYLLEYRLKMKEKPLEIRDRFTSGICDSCGDYFESLENVQGKWLCEDCRDELEE